MFVLILWCYVGFGVWMAGLAGGACIALDVPSRQYSLGLYFLCRSLYFIVRILMQWGWLPRVRNLSMWLFGAANGPIMYSFLYYPKYLEKVSVYNRDNFFTRALNGRDCNSDFTVLVLIITVVMLC